MAIGAFLRRDLIVSTRRRTVFSDRFAGVILLALVFFGGAAIADWLGWDRHSVAGAVRFSMAIFGLYIAIQLLFATGMVASLGSTSIASERDRKTLDALLATRVTSADLVLGAVSSGLVRYANSVLPAIPLLVLFVAVDPRLVLLGLAGVTSTAILMAALAVTVSARAHTAAKATQATVALIVTWMWVPLLFLMILPRAWPAVASWATPFALPLLDSSPLGIGLNLGGIIVRGTVVDSIVRMIAYQSIVAVLLIVWTISRLRAASRSVYDEEGRSAFRRMLHLQSRSRPPCGDDPVLWREIHPRRSSTAKRLAGYALNAVGMGLVASVLSWFALPAFSELFRAGYGAGRDSLPDIHPLAQMLFVKISGIASGLLPGQARLEFNIILRQATAVLGFVYVLLVAGAAAESIVVERERDTWSGLIATPLTGREILRAKMVGVLWKARGLWIMMIALWVVGVLSGSVHPLGLLAALVGLGVTSWLLASIGVYASLWGRDRNQALGWALSPLLATMGLTMLPFALPGLASVLLGNLTMPFQMWEALVSFEDVHAVFQAGASSQLESVGVRDLAGVGMVVVSWLIVIVAQGAGACLLSRAAYRGFDRAVGRPVQ